jgi:hypothetical protein
MISRKLLSKLVQAKTFRERYSITADCYPGTKFDELFLNLTKVWTESHEDEKGHESRIRNKVMREDALAWSSARRSGELTKSWSPKALAKNAKANAEFLQWVGMEIAEVCIKGDSKHLRDMADALVIWNLHEPKRDIRHKLVSVCLGRRSAISMRQICTRLRYYGIEADEDTRRTIRRIAPGLGINIKGDSGRPGKAKP